MFVNLYHIMWQRILENRISPTFWEYAHGQFWRYYEREDSSWDETASRLVNSYWRFGGAFCQHYQVLCGISRRNTPEYLNLIYHRYLIVQEVDKTDVILQWHFGDQRACNCHTILRGAYQITLPTSNTCGQDQSQSWHIHLELTGHIYIIFPLNVAAWCMKLLVSLSERNGKVFLIYIYI